MSEAVPTHLDLFSGIGGFSLAAEAAGFRTIGFAETDRYASAILRKHWPHVPNYGDVRTVPTLRCYILTGGFPCQPFSKAGKRRGSSDYRYLWPSMLDAIRRCRPAWVLGENVPGLIGMELERCLADLESISFRPITFAIPACAAGAWHIRERVWIAAYNASSHVEMPKVETPTWADVEPRRFTRALPPPWSPFRPEDIARMDGGVHGVPYFTHRAHCIGNAIVPQVAKVILKNIRQLI